MPVLRMMLRLFTTILGTTHPREEEEDKYALMLFAVLVLIVGSLGGMIWMVTAYFR